MLSVIIDTTGAEDRLAGLLAVLTPAAVEGLTREVLVSGSGEVTKGVDLLCEDMGAEWAGALAQAVNRAKSDWLLVLPARIRFRNGWVERLSDHLAGGGGPALLEGEKRGLFAVRPAGVLIARRAAAGSGDLGRLRRKAGAAAKRLG